MPKIGIAKVSALYDGDYELDLGSAFTTREWRWIKQIADYSPATIDAGLDDTDPSLFCALAVIAMQRAGKITREQVLEAADVLVDAPFDGSTISIQPDEVEEDDEIPPVLTSEPAEPSQSGSLEKPRSSGESSTNGSDQSDETLEPTGTTRSPTSPMLAATTSET